MKYCRKWWCGERLTRTVKRTCQSRGAVVTVVVLRCPKCGWHMEDYDVAHGAGMRRAGTKAARK